MGVRTFLKRKLKERLGMAPGDALERPEPSRGTPATSPRPEPESGASVGATDGRGWTAVCRSDALSADRTGTFEVHGDTVAVFRTLSGDLFAIANACTHEDGPLGEGEVEGTTVTCPYHDWRFDLRSGECLSQDERAVACYPTDERDELVWVGPPTSHGSSARGGEHDDGMVTV